ncbi:MAG: hypothetical protein G01um101420_221 [Parcubacteria group bacterium Gr01-1014_20]|nr:MAG: hypothetical protein G01um101420_221 [Parcubacteria group bacterium Gr01-1014_20]
MSSISLLDIFEKLEREGAVRKLALWSYPNGGGVCWRYEVIRPEALPVTLKIEFARDGELRL